METLDIVQMRDTDQEEESALQRAVWLSQEIDIAMPPIPGMLAESIDDKGGGRIFASDPSLVAFDSIGALEDRLGRDWPVSGIAFGYVERGLSGFWFYTLVGARMMLCISLRLRAQPEVGDLAGVQAVTFAHERLEHYLSRDANYAALTGTKASSDDAVRRIVVYSDADGLPGEVQATWSPTSGLGVFTPASDVFTAQEEAPLSIERIIWV